MKHEIPTEFTIGFLNRTIEIHWGLHAWLMFICWFVLVPFGVMSIRYLKTRPVPLGLPRGVGKFDPLFIWWVMHIWTLYTAIGLSLLGAAIALVVSGGFSGSVHSFFGIATVLFGTLQIVAAWNRGSHGGHNHLSSDPDDPSTWRGDHFDMTPKRRLFEAYHKPGGYFSVFLAIGAVASGLVQFWMPAIAITLGLIFIGGFVLIVFSEFRGYRYDTYRAVFGSHPDHPGNKKREGL
ncbi:MAG: hypothetical protein KDA67_11305 [Rhodobacteraceae bacterium]|nr:hypothetical protein [Paracoccaceae bacterium]